MKLSDYFFSSGVRALSVVAGLIGGFGMGFFTEWRIGLLAGLVIVLLTSIILPIVLYLQDLPYERKKKQLNKDFLLDVRVRFTVQGGSTVKGFFMLTDESMIFLSLDGGEHLLELQRKDVHTIRLGDPVTINIFLSEKQYVRIISGLGEELFESLRENGWSVSDV